jgi:rubrerythrin
VADVRQAFGDIDYGMGAKHLGALIEILERARNDGMAEAAEVLETAQFALAEAQKKKPNTVTLGALLTGLHHTVATIATWPGALEAIRNADHREMKSERRHEAPPQTALVAHQR